MTMSIIVYLSIASFIVGSVAGTVVYRIARGWGYREGYSVAQRDASNAMDAAWEQVRYVDETKTEAIRMADAPPYLLLLWCIWEIKFKLPSNELGYRVRHLGEQLLAAKANRAAEDSPSPEETANG